MKQGMLSTRGCAILMMDADGATKMADMDKLDEQLALMTNPGGARLVILRISGSDNLDLPLSFCCSSQASSSARAMHPQQLQLCTAAAITSLQRYGACTPQLEAAILCALSVDYVDGLTHSAPLLIRPGPSVPGTGTFSPRCSICWWLSLLARGHRRTRSAALRCRLFASASYLLPCLVKPAWLLECSWRSYSPLLIPKQLFSRRAAQLLFPNQRLQRWCFDVELTWLAQQLHVPIAEVGVTWTEIPGEVQACTTMRSLRKDFLMRPPILLQDQRSGSPP